MVSPRPISIVIRGDAHPRTFCDRVLADVALCAALMSHDCIQIPPPTRVLFSTRKVCSRMVRPLDNTDRFSSSFFRQRRRWKRCFDQVAQVGNTLGPRADRDRSVCPRVSFHPPNSKVDGGGSDQGVEDHFNFICHEDADTYSFAFQAT